MRCRFTDVLGCLGVCEDSSMTLVRQLHTVVNLVPRTTGLTLPTQEAESRIENTTASF